MAEPRYQDFVIRNGQLVGDFDGLYREFDDPWHQSREDHQSDTRRMIAVDYCSRLRAAHGNDQVSRVVEYGCGFGYLTDTLRRRGFSAVGVDVAAGAVTKARAKNPSSVFLTRSLEDLGLLDDLDPDVVVMAEVTWYVLDHLAEFRSGLRAHAARRERPTFLIHLLTTYAPGVQQYGTDFFTDLDGILQFFDFDFLESGFISTPRDDDPLSRGTYFVARVV